VFTSFFRHEKSFSTICWIFQISTRQKPETANIKLWDQEKHQRNSGRKQGCFEFEKVDLPHDGYFSAVFMFNAIKGHELHIIDINILLNKLMFSF
jgi:hypothetical protein